MYIYVYKKFFEITSCKSYGSNFSTIRQKEKNVTIFVQYTANEKLKGKLENCTEFYHKTKFLFYSFYRHFQIK